jgi:hypothetical protein
MARHVQDLVSEQFAAGLGTQEERAMWVHLRSCAECRDAYDREAEADALLGSGEGAVHRRTRRREVRLLRELATEEGMVLTPAQQEETGLAPETAPAPPDRAPLGLLASIGQRLAAWGQGLRTAGAIPWAAAAVAVALLAVWAVPTGRQGAAGDDWRARGATGPEVEDADVAWLATSAGGPPRAPRDGDTVALSERLGFVYGNPSGARRHLVVLGWDGARVHWYYPSAPGEPPQPLQSGPSARGLRLPFDIGLAQDHRPGPLTVVAVFDGDAEALARDLRSERVPQGPAVRTLRITLVEEPGR